ncbi:MAG TPA: anti-sigma factor, partial [Geminicoccaceae bacterium]
MKAATAAEPDDPGTSLAGEYVLGLLEGEERARFERRLAADPALRREVIGWERRLAPLAESVDEVAPPPDVWPRIERSLRDALRPAWGSVEWRRGERNGRGAAGRRGGGAATVVPVLWRVWAVGATAAAAALAGLLVVRPEPAAAPRLIAVLSDAQARPAFLVSTAPSERRVAAESVANLQPGDRAHELWVLPGGTGAPVSL